MKEIKKAFQAMYKNYNNIGNDIKGNFREKDRMALITIGTYHLENGVIQDTYGNSHKENEKEWERELEKSRNKFMRSDQFREFIRSTGAMYTEEDNVKWNVGHGHIVMSKQIRFKF